MTLPTQPLSEITREAVAVLIRELGVTRTLRFMGQYRTGQGNYTVERHDFLEEEPLEALFEEARRLDESWKKNT